MWCCFTVLCRVVPHITMWCTLHCAIMQSVHNYVVVQNTMWCITCGTIMCSIHFVVVQVCSIHFSVVQLFAVFTSLWCNYAKYSHQCGAIMRSIHISAVQSAGVVRSHRRWFRVEQTSLPLLSYLTRRLVCYDEQEASDENEQR